MFKTSSSYPIVDLKIQGYVEKLSKPSPLMIPAGIDSGKYHKIMFDCMCFQDLCLSFKLSSNGHFIFDNGLAYWSTEKWYDKSNVSLSPNGFKSKGLKEFIEYVHKNYGPLSSSTGLFTF